MRSRMQKNNRMSDLRAWCSPKPATLPAIKSQGTQTPTNWECRAFSTEVLDNTRQRTPLALLCTMTRKKKGEGTLNSLAPRCPTPKILVSNMGQNIFFQEMDLPFHIFPAMVHHSTRSTCRTHVLAPLSKKPGTQGGQINQQCVRVTVRKTWVLSFIEGRQGWQDVLPE